MLNNPPCANSACPWPWEDIQDANRGQYSTGWSFCNVTRSIQAREGARGCFCVACMPLPWDPSWVGYYVTLAVYLHQLPCNHTDCQIVLHCSICRSGAPCAADLAAQDCMPLLWYFVVHLWRESTAFNWASPAGQKNMSEFCARAGGLGRSMLGGIH